MRYMGIDFGSKKVGIALSDESGAMGFPHSIIPNDGRLLRAVVALVKEKGVDRVVFGESRMLSGKDNPLAQSARTFAEALTKETNIPISFESEVFTTQEARRDPEGVWQSKTGNVDAQAAALILTSYLSRDDHD